MSKKSNRVNIPKETTASYPYGDKEDLLNDIQQHFQWWTDDNEIRSTRENGWKDITDAYWGVLPDDWPFISRTVDPRIRTTLLEKNARLTNRALKGQVVGRDNESDPVKARINNAVISAQWDMANYGGTMQEKISTSDMDTRLYQSKFAYIYWRTVIDKDGKVTFDGNEAMPLNINDCGLDPNCDHVRNANWFQHRMWKKLSDLELNASMYPGLRELKRVLQINPRKGFKPVQKRRDNEWKSRAKEIRGLEDRMGMDPSFPVIQVVVEYRVDKWITFCPDYNIILAISPNPYDHKKIPISQLRYYQNDGDNLGESEVESVLPLWRAIQAVMCAFLDEVILKMRPPLKVVEGAARQETIVRYPDAQWLVDNPNAITEMETRGESVRYFQNTYPMLVSAFNVAMGDLSQGTSNLDPIQPDKTATEIRQVVRQQNARDQKNQQSLAEFIKDIVSMWLVNNKQFLFKDQNKQEHVVKLIGEENFNYFKRLGMDEMVLPDEAAAKIKEIIDDSASMNAAIPPEQLDTMIEASKIPKFPIIENPEEEDLSKLKIKSKLRLSELGDGADLSVIPEDLEGLYDYIPYMKSMENSAGDQQSFARMQAITQVTNPNVLQLLALEGKRPKISELLIANYEEMGLNDAAKFFESVGPNESGITPTGSVLPPQQDQGMAKPPQAVPQQSVDQQMAISNRV